MSHLSHFPDSKGVFVGFLLLTLFILPNVSAQSPFPVPKLQSPIVFDGVVEENEWKEIDTLPLVTHWPKYGVKSPYKTSFRIAYDQKFVYFSVTCYDTLDLIRAPYFERDKWQLNTDQVTLALDTYNDD